jgi:hypothetical protein
MKIRSHLSVLLLVAFSMNASIDNPHSHSTKVNPAVLLGTASLGIKSVRCSDEGFTVKDKEGVHLVERGDTDDTIRRLIPSNIQAFMQKGKIKITKATDGKYILRSQIDGLGGGPVLGAMAYWGTKALCYAGLVTTVSVATVSGVGAVAGAVGAGAATTATVSAMAVAGAKVGTAAVVATTTGVSMGATAGVAAAGLGATAAASTATTLATTSVIASTAATTGGFLGFIEGLSLAAGALGTACIWLP